MTRDGNDRRDLEERLIAEIIRMSGIRYGEIELNVWKGQLKWAGDRTSRRAGDPPHTITPLDVFEQDRHVREHVASLAALWKSPFATVRLEIREGRLQRLDLHRTFSEPPGEMRARL